METLPHFWNSAYARYRRPLSAGLGFHVPAFPHPLISPNFVTGDRAAFLRANAGTVSHFNEIVPLGYDQRGPAPEGYRLETQFFLGERHIAQRELESVFKVRTLTLAEAARGEELWSLLDDGFPRDAPFFRGLLPFFATLDADFRTSFLERNGKIVGAVTVGVAAGAALVLNAVVPAELRGQGLSAPLMDVAQNLGAAAGATRALFWAEHAFFGRHAEQVRHYRIFRAWPPAC